VNYRLIKKTKSGTGELAGSHGDEHEDDLFWDVAPCSLVEIDQCFRGAYCLHHQGYYTVQHPRKQSSSSQAQIKLCKHTKLQACVLLLCK
jgi:hypothetical protein